MSSIALFANGAVEGGKTILIPDSMEDLLKIASHQFEFQAKRVYNVLGEEIEDLTLLENGQFLYVSKGEPYIRLDKNALKTMNASGDAHRQGEWVRLNVGGTYFTTTRTTLLKEPESMLAKMFDTDLEPSKVDITGAYLIDRDPLHFKTILNYLRDGSLTIEGHTNRDILLNEAYFFGLKSLVSAIGNRLAKRVKAITRPEIVNTISSIAGRDRPSFKLLRYSNLTGCNLHLLSLSGFNFEGASFRCCNMGSANLSNCCLENADFEGADAEQCNFEGSNMRGANLTGANLRASSFANCNMQGATLAGANLQLCEFKETILTKANLEGSNLSESRFESSNLEEVNLQDAKICEAVIIECNFINANLKWVDIRSSIIVNCDLRWVDLSGADLIGINWLPSDESDIASFGSDLSEANLSGASLVGLNLQHWNLQGADLTNAEMTKCTLTGCILTKVEFLDSKLEGCPNKNGNLRNAILVNADMEGCNLSYCQLQGAKLDGANLEDVIIEEARRELVEQLAE